MPAFTYTFVSSPRLGYHTSLRSKKNWYTVDTRKLEDLDFADELCLMTPHNLQHRQEKTVALQSAYAIREDRKI